MEPKVVYAVYSQLYPSYEYEPTIESIWSNEDTAKSKAEEIFKSQPIGYRFYDDVYVRKLTIDSEDLYGN